MGISSSLFSFFFFFSSRRRHTRFKCDWSSDVCSSDLRLMLRAADSVDPVTLVAAYHTAYNVMGVALLLPLIGPFTRLIERIVPERGSPLTRGLDSAALAGAPTVAVEAVRRAVARVLAALCASQRGGDAMVRDAH